MKWRLRPGLRMDAPAPQDDEFPWWLVAVLALGACAFWQVLSDSMHRQILLTLLKGVRITVFVTLVSFALASGVGLLLAPGSSSRWRWVRQSARFDVEIVRGVPILVLLLYVAFVLAPALVELANWVGGRLGFDPVRSREFPLLWRAVLALVIAYSAFISDVFRAGFASVPAGQVEAAKALGLSGRHRFRFIVFPQAIKTVLPPLGNDLVAQVKDSSLVSVLGVLDVTQLGKVTAASNFRYFETCNVVALVYLRSPSAFHLPCGGRSADGGHRLTEPDRKIA